jgi:hypothetical protein
MALPAGLTPSAPQVFAAAGALFATAQSEDVGGVAYIAHVDGCDIGLDRRRRP